MMVTIFYLTDNIPSGFKQLDYDIFKELGYDVILVESRPTPREMIRNVLSLMQAIKQHDVDKKRVVYGWFAYTCQGPIIGRLFGIPSIIVAGGNDVSDDPYVKLGPKYMTFFSKIMTKMGLKYSTRIVAVSKFIKKRIFHLGKKWDIHDLESKTSVIYPAVDEQWLRLKKKELTNGDYNYFITVGHLSKNSLVQKGYLILLEAIMINKNWLKKNKIKIIFFGKECDLSLRTEIKKRNLENFAKIVPFNREKLPSYLAGAIAYLQISTHESFGVAMVEAMAMGCPVVASNIAALPEVAGDAAIYVEPDNVKQISQKMIELYKNKQLREKLSIQGITCVNNYFSKEIRMSNLKKIIDDVL